MPFRRAPLPPIRPKPLKTHDIFLFLLDYFTKASSRNGRKGAVRDWRFHCAILGVPETASAKDVRKAYRRLALLRHPDKHNNSPRAKEDFQQLNESYRALMDLMKDGQLPPPPPPRDVAAASTEAVRHPFATKPTPISQNLAPTPLSSRHFSHKKIIAHSAIACFIALVLSCMTDIWLARRPASAPVRVEYSASSWCRIHTADAPANDIFAAIPESACQKSCALVAGTRDPECSWNGVRFRASKNTPPDPAPEAEAARCQVTVDRGITWQGLELTRRSSQRQCELLCREQTDVYPRAGVECAWAAKNFFRKEITRSAEEPAPAPEPAVPSLAQNDFGDVCFMSVISPGDYRVTSYPEETLRSCYDRCEKEAKAHPLDAEVQCAFGGRQILKHMPDPLTSYLSKGMNADRSPARDESKSAAPCEITEGAGTAGTRVQEKTVTAASCEKACQEVVSAGDKNLELTCRYAGKEFFRRTKPQ